MNIKDNEIKKAFMICNNLEDGYCSDCPYEHCDRCIRQVAINTLDLINRLEAEKEVLEARIGVYETCNARKDEAIKHLEAENERLKNAYKQCAFERDAYIEIENTAIAEAKAEAYKEFAERLKDGTGYYDEMIKDVVYTEEEVDNLLKELVGEDK